LREFDSGEAIRMARNSVYMFDRMMDFGKRNYLIQSRRIRALQRLAEAQLKARHISEARRTAELALASEQPLAAAYAAEGEEQLVLVRLLIVAGNANDAAHDLLRAENLLREARARAEQIARRGELPNVLCLAHAEEALGNYYASHRRYQEARVCYVDLTELWRRFSETNEYVNRQRVTAERLLASLPAIS
jgi:tetratricopeptide (TPR) repeat protein